MKKKNSLLLKNGFKCNLNHFFYFFLFFLLIFLDQISKYLVRKNFLISESHKFLFFNITYLENTGVSFGMFKNNNLLFIIISIVAFLFFLHKFFSLNYNQNIFRIPLIILLSGILGNLIDRIFLGYVVDFIDFRFWPVFNLADSYLTISLIFILYLSFKKKKDLF